MYIWELDVWHHVHVISLYKNGAIFEFLVTNNRPVGTAWLKARERRSRQPVDTNVQLPYKLLFSQQDELCASNMADGVPVSHR